MDTSGMDAYQLAFINLGFQALGVFLNVIVLLFQNVLTAVFSGIFGLFSGTTM